MLLELATETGPSVSSVSAAEINRLMTSSQDPFGCNSSCSAKGNVLY